MPQFHALDEQGRWELYAAVAMHALCSKMYPSSDKNSPEQIHSLTEISSRAFDMADAMIETADKRLVSRQDTNT